MAAKHNRAVNSKELHNQIVSGIIDHSPKHEKSIILHFSVLSEKRKAQSIRQKMKYTRALSEL